MPLFLYLDHNTFVHRRHPLVKVLSLILFFIAAFIMEHPLFILPLSIGVGVLSLWSRATSTLYRLRMLFLFIGVFTVLIWSIFYRGGTPVASSAFLPITQEGILYGLGMATKLSTFLATGALFL
ncbi:MAG: CbiQ family ECF transporter T component, partial [Candidatus Binatia bacterium]